MGARCLRPGRRRTRLRARDRIAADRRYGNVRAAAGTIGHGSLHAAFAETDRHEAGGRRNDSQIAVVLLAILELFPDGARILVARSGSIFQAAISELGKSEDGLGTAKVGEAVAL